MQNGTGDYLQLQKQPPEVFYASQENTCARVSYRTPLDDCFRNS